MGKSQVHIQVGLREKAKWERYAENDPSIEHGHLSKLFKRAVREKVGDIDNTQDGSGEGATEVDLSPVLENQAHTEKELSQLKQSLNQISTKVEEVNREVTSGNQKRPLEERLPETRAWRRVQNHDPDAPREHWETAWSGTVIDLAKRVGEKPATVENKLDELGFPSDDVDGEKRYWLEQIEIDNSGRE